jgi:hypothetical protein
MGEGSIGTVNANMEYLYYGYVDSVQRVINTGGSGDASTLPFGSPLAPTNFPIVPEYEWRVAAKNQVNHGNGFYHRFFGPSDGPNVVQSDGQPIYPLTQDALDLYLAFCISYGHAGFLITNGSQGGDEGYITHPEAAQTYFMTNALQSLYFSSPISAIRYANQGQWKSFEQVLFDTETLDSFRHVPLRLEFANGLRITVNHGPAPLTMLDGGQSFTLPAKTGWYASLPNGSFRAFSAIPPGTNGKRIDYCLATGQYEYFNGRGQVAGYGGISTLALRSAWNVLPGNLSVAEDSGGQLGVTLGPPPGLLGIAITPADIGIAAGQRIGLRATASFDNGGQQDVTTLLIWFSTQPNVATVNNAGVLTAVGSGSTKIVAMDPTGALIALPLTVTVL